MESINFLRRSLSSTGRLPNKTNSLLGAHFILSQDRFERIKAFAKDKNRLALLLFADKLNMKGLQERQGEMKKIVFELNDDQEAMLEQCFREF